ncbi:hypothetical protein FJTKL_12390 [Diaporthe vaccinii]|uniref:Proteophosphoglycan ppg4 n=1 Tax=Diaporthe vaccinii TaxID=105482 RepID=A0ABR4EE10_9PEZI
MRPQMAANNAISTPTRSFLSSASANRLPVTPSPIAPDAPLRRQGPSHPRFAAFATQDWVRPPVILSPLTSRVQWAARYRRMAASPRSSCTSASSVPSSPHADLAPYSPLVFSSGSSRSTPLANQLPDDLCTDRSELIDFDEFVERYTKKQAAVGGWVYASHSPFSCESAVASPLASSVTDSWSSRSTSIATVSSGSPLAYRLPVLQREHTLLGALVGKRVWRFSSGDKEAYLNALHRDDPHNLLQTPDNVARTASLHKWIADIPTPDAPSPVQPHPSPSLSPSLFSPLLSSPSLAEQAPPPLSPSPMSPLPSDSSDSLAFLSPSDSLAFLSGSSSAASPSPRRSPAASVRSEQTSSPVVKSPDSPTLTDALAKLKALVEAGPPSPVARSPSPVALSPSPVALSPSPIAPSPPTLNDALATLKALVEAGPPSPVTRFHSPSPSPSPSPVVASTNAHLVPPTTLSSSPAIATVNTLLDPPPVARSLKRKLPQDASPAPRRTRPAVIRFEPPTPVFHFAPTLPESLPSFPTVLPAMPGTFPTDLHLEPTPVTPSSTPSSVSWKAVAGIAAGAFALGLVVSRYLF